jgi:hypothetical protein
MCRRHPLQSPTHTCALSRDAPFNLNPLHIATPHSPTHTHVLFALAFSFHMLFPIRTARDTRRTLASGDGDIGSLRRALCGCCKHQLPSGQKNHRTRHGRTCGWVHFRESLSFSEAVSITGLPNLDLTLRQYEVAAAPSDTPADATASAQVVQLVKRLEPS